MEDGGFDAEVTKMKPYLTKTSTTVDSTAIYSKYFTTRDLAFPKAYTKATLPTTLTSRFGVQYNVDKTQIVGEPIQLSNGVIYIMKKVDVTLQNRLLTTKIEGENNTASTGSRSRLQYRTLQDPLGISYKDVWVVNSGIANFVLSYGAKDLYSTKYQVYWRAINNPQTTTLSQKLIIGGKWDLVGTVNTLNNQIANFGYIVVNPNVYDEVYLGDFTLKQAGKIDLITLWGANSTTNGANTMTLDYLKFVPVIN
jgi:hypothetical protein